MIIEVLGKKREVRVSDIVSKTGFSRAYINRFFQELRDEGKIVLLGKANRARYVSATQTNLRRAMADIKSVHRILNNQNLFEDTVLKDIKKSTGIFNDVSDNVSRILDYAFTEMLNNAIEHSLSKKIEITMKNDEEHAAFIVMDKGVGIFNNIMGKKKLRNVMEAIQDLLKGKQTTAPQAHSGEGIFFTSKAADVFTIKSGRKKIIFNNLLEDIFIQDIKDVAGTTVMFSISRDSKKQLSEVFKEYTNDLFEFSKTKVTVKLYKLGDDYVSRSQARRIVSGLDKFRTIVLDFKHISTVGQGFADEIFRVWQSRYPRITIDFINADENVNFMINRALA